MNQWKALPSWLIQQASLPSSVVYFVLLFSFLSSWSLLFPLSTAFRTVLSSCQGNESESLLSATTLFLCLTLPFLCLGPLAVRSAPSCLSTLRFDPPRPMMSQREQGLLGSDPRLNELVSSKHFCRLKGCRKLLVLSFQESASLVWRKCLLFQEVSSALLKSFKVAPCFPIFLQS